MTTKRIVWILVVAAAAAGLWVVFRDRPVPVDVAVIRRGTVRSFVEEEGQTRVVDRFIVSTPVAGRLARLELEEGDVVDAGRVLAEIDPLPIRTRIEEVEAQIRALEHRIEGAERRKPKPMVLESARLAEQVAKEAQEVAVRQVEEARAAFDIAHKTADRERQLTQTGTGLAADLDAAVANEIQARARVQAAELQVKIRDFEIKTAELKHAELKAELEDYEWQKDDYRSQIVALQAQLESLRDDLAHTKIVAPAAGSVLVLHKESQQVVQAGEPILELGDVARLEVEVEYLSEDAARMKVGMPAEIFGRALGDTVLPAKVKRIHPSAFRKISSLGVEQQRVYVILGFDGGGLGDRYRVEARVILDERPDAVLVPEGALFRDDGSWHAFAIDGERARLVAVKTGLRDGKVREVTSGLAEGDRVVLHPDDAVTSGAALEVLNER